MNTKKAERVSVEQVVDAYKKNKGNIRATAKQLGVERSTVRRKLEGTGIMKKPLVGGTKLGVQAEVRKPAAGGEVKRYILTSAQNNTHVHAEFLANLEALAEHYSAEIIVGTYTYNQNHYGKLAVKKGKDKPAETELWYDPAITKYIKDSRIELGKGLVWCGEYNALPTNVNPLAGLESFTGRKSSIFPHAKLALRSIPTMQGEGVKLNYTTGTVTQRNYIQKREGVIAEFHHIYGALLVEVDENGNWWVRQLNHDEGTDTLQDLNVLVEGGKVVSTKANVEAITHGDLHGTMADPEAVKLALEMRDVLKPKYQFLHDVMEGAAVNPHARKYGTSLERFWNWNRGYSRLEKEIQATTAVLNKFVENYDGETVIVDSNHDDAWLKRWIQEYNYRVDPANARIYLDLAAYAYEQIADDGSEEGPKMPRDVNVLEYALNKWGALAEGFRFLKADESFLTCDRKIENGQHGHYGPSGKFGSPAELSKMARKANTAHTHSTGIFNGLYISGTLSKFRWDYTKGPSNWTQSEVVTYSNGKRTIVTFYANKWKA
jgi:transposase-like protein